MGKIISGLSIFVKEVDCGGLENVTPEFRQGDGKVMR
jgi:hypothetical protein